MLEGEKAASLHWVDTGRPAVGCPKEGRLSRLMLGLPERGQTFNVLRMGSECPSVFGGLGLLEGEKAASLQWVDIGRPSVGRESGLSEGGHPQSVDVGLARARADL